MTRKHHVLLGFMILIFVFVSTPSLAEKRTVQLSLVTPVQIFPEEDTVHGVRLNLIYGRNATVSGLDIGLINHTTAGTSTAWQLGLVGYTDADFVGWQDNHVVNVVTGNFKGFQSGIVNYAKSARGVQFGILNVAEKMYGLQIGFINIIRQDGLLPVLPFINFSF